MLVRCPPYFTPQTGVLTRGMSLREIQQPASNSGEGPAWTEEFRRALAREDLALTTVRAYHGDLGAFVNVVQYVNGLDHLAQSGQGLG